MKKLKKTLCLFLVLVMCLGLVNIGALAATFDDLQAAINGTADQKPAESSESAESGSSGETTEPSGTVGESPEASDPHANGTRFDYTDKDGNVSDRYGYGWNADTNGWGIHAWNSTTTNEDGTTTTNRNVQLQEDVKGDSDPEGSPDPSGITVGEGQNVTIDLNGNDIDGSDRYKDKDGNPVSSTTPQDATINVEGGGDLTLKNSDTTDPEKGKVIGSDKHNVVTVTGKDGDDPSTLTLENGVNITHDAGNKLENMPEANPVVPADPDPTEDGKSEETKSEETKSEDGKSEETKSEETKSEETKSEETKSEDGKSEETKKPTFTTGNNPDGTKDEKPTTGRGVEVSDGGKLTMNGGKITDNKVGGGIDEKPDTGTSGWWNGKDTGCFSGEDGGGVWVHNGGSFVMNDGEISNNAAAEGGGVFVGNDNVDDDKTSSFQMTGGKVDGNVAKSGEGGGIYIRSTGGTTGNKITGGNITGNATFTTKDLGGGGIYVENGAELQIKNLVLTGNVANGLGGGLAGCVHGKTMINIADGSIIYGNSANGNAVTAGHNGNGYLIDGHTEENGTAVWVTKDKDGNTTSKAQTEVKNGAQDVFSAGDSSENNGGGIYIPTEMLNGIKPGWKGFVYDANGNKTEISLDDNNKVVVTGKNALGLTTDTLTPDELAQVQRFLDNVRENQRVLVSGNYSNVHGGGIGNNGVLTIGTRSDSKLDGLEADITIDTTKNVNVKDPDQVGEDMRVDDDDKNVVKDSDGKDKYNLKDGEFTFELVKAGEDGEYNADFAGVQFATNAADGKVNVKIPSSMFDKNAGTYTFYLREKAGDADGITYDGTVYKIVVTVKETVEDQFTFGKMKDENGNWVDFDSITINKLTVDSKTVTKMVKNADGQWVEVKNESGNSNVSSAEFNNTYTKKTEECVDISVRKTWDDNNDPNRPASVTIRLMRNGELYETIILSDDNNWQYLLKGLDLLDENGDKINWTVEEVGIDGYTTGYGKVDHDTKRGFDVTVTNTKEPESPGPGPGPGPDPDPDPEPTDIPDEEPPLVDIPDEETPTTDIPDEEPPLVEIPDEEPPLVDIPDEEPPLVEIPDEEPPLVDMPPETDIPDVDVPLADVPQTGDYSLVWCAVAVVSVLGLAVLTLKKREDEEA